MSNVMYLSIKFLKMEAKQCVVPWTFSSAIFNSIRDARSSVLRSFYSTWLSLFFRTYTSEFGICLFSTPLILITAGWKWSETCFYNIGFNFFAMYIWVNMTRTTGLPACSYAAATYAAQVCRRILQIFHATYYVDSPLNIGTTSHSRYCTTTKSDYFGTF